MTDKHTLVEHLQAAPLICDGDGRRFYIPETLWREVIARITALEAREAELVDALERVLPYTEAERLAEESKVRTGLTRVPIRVAVARARATLAKHQEGEGNE